MVSYQLVAVTTRGYTVEIVLGIVNSATRRLARSDLAVVRGLAGSGLAVM